MALGQIDSGNPSVSNASETTLDSGTTDHVAQFLVDISNFTDNTRIDLKLYEAARSGGTQRLAWFGVEKSVNRNVLIMTPGVMLMHDWKLTAEHDEGSATNIKWSTRETGATPTTVQGADLSVATGATWVTMNTTTPIVTAGIYQFFFDLNNFTGNTYVEFRLLDKATGTGDTLTPIWQKAFQPNFRDEKLLISDALILTTNGTDIEIRHDQGSNVTVPWEYRKST